MKAEQKDFIEIMNSFRKLNISSMLPDVSHGEFHLLKLIERCSGEMETGEGGGNGVRVSCLVREIHAPAPAVSRTLRSLEEKHLVIRTVDESDRRNTFAALTEEGHARLAEIDCIMEGFADAVFGNLGDETMRKLNSYLRDFLEASRKEIEKRKYTERKGV